LADAVYLAFLKYNKSSHLNIGSGYEISIRELAHLISGIIGYSGKIVFNPNEPNGTPRKILDSTQIRNLGWKPRINLKYGLLETVNWFISANTNGKARI